MKNFSFAHGFVPLEHAKIFECDEECNPRIAKVAYFIAVLHASIPISIFLINFVNKMKQKVKLDIKVVYCLLDRKGNNWKDHYFLLLYSFHATMEWSKEKKQRKNLKKEISSKFVAILLLHAFHFCIYLEKKSRQ